MRKFIVTFIIAVTVIGTLSSASAGDNRYNERRVMHPSDAVAAALAGGIAGFAAGVIIAGSQPQYRYHSHRRVYRGYDHRWQQPRGYRYEPTINCRGHLSYEARRGQYYDTRSGLTCSGH